MPDALHRIGTSKDRRRLERCGSDDMGAPTKPPLHVCKCGIHEVFQVGFGLVLSEYREYPFIDSKTYPTWEVDGSCAFGLTLQAGLGENAL